MYKLMAVILMVLVSCSGGGLEQLIPPGRLDVTPQLRDACTGVVGGDPLIEGIIHVLEEARLDGGLYTEGAIIINNDCNFEGCIVCGLAVLNQVYGI